MVYDLPPGRGMENVSRHPGWPAMLGPLVVSAGTVQLRPPRLRDAAAWSQLRLNDRDYLECWEPTSLGRWEDRNAVLAWPPQWSSMRALARRGQGLPFVITVDGEFSGQLTVGNVVRGALRSAWIGYWVARAAAGGGVATASVALALDHCFGPVGLHRLEATVQPDNAASRRVLVKVGFREEGFFRRYLDVAGAWRDHCCYAITAEDLPEGAVVPLARSGNVGRP